MMTEQAKEAKVAAAERTLAAAGEKLSKAREKADKADKQITYWIDVLDDYNHRLQIAERAYEWAKADLEHRKSMPTVAPTRPATQTEVLNALISSVTEDHDHDGPVWTEADIEMVGDGQEQLPLWVEQ